MGMVVNMGTNDQYFVFRGSAAREFLAGLDFLSHRAIRLVLADGRHISAKLSITHARTFCLSLECEDLSDPMAELLFDVTIDKFIAEGRGHHGRA